MKPSNKAIFVRSIGRPAIMIFVILTGINLVTGQHIPELV